MMRRIAVICLVVATVGCCMAQAQTYTAKTKTVALQCGNLFDGRGDSLRKNVVIVVEDGKIKEIAAAVPAGAEVIDLPAPRVCPG